MNSIHDLEVGDGFPQPGGRPSDKPEFSDLQAEFSFSNSLVYLSASFYPGTELFCVFRFDDLLQPLHFLFKGPNPSGKGG
jgi:hypothetical protein